jgi:hypothetical protein
MSAVKVLDTTVGETGTTQTMKNNWLKKDKPLRFSIDIGSGDTVIIEGRSDSGEDFEQLHEFTDETPADVYVSRYWRARRTTDGGGESEVFVEDRFNQKITAHTS